MPLLLGDKTYNVLRKNKGKKKILQLIPNSEDVFTSIESQDAIDIGVTKTGYLRIFKEAHDYWHANVLPQYHQHGNKYISRLKTQELLDVYKMTISYLFTTNDHHMIVKLHELVLVELYKRDNAVLEEEFEILTTLISCKLGKINKNSMLWLLIKKLVVILIYLNQGQNPSETYRVLIISLITSLQFHFANYYAGNFMKWLIQVNSMLKMIHYNEILLEELLNLCHQQLNDVTLWSTLTVFLDPIIPQYIIQDYNMTITDINKKFSPSLSHLHIDSVTFVRLVDNNLASNQLDWLLKVNCRSITPYKSILTKTSMTEELREKVFQLYTQEKEQLNHYNNSFEEAKVEYINVLKYLINR